MEGDATEDDERMFTSELHTTTDNTNVSGVDSTSMSLNPEETHAQSDAADTDDHKQGTRRARRRHGACNQHKMKHLVRWLHENFFDKRPGVKHRILDVAGGKGELAARLTMCHGMTVTLVDPRRADIPSVYVKDVVPRLPSKWQDRLNERRDANPNVVQETVNERFQQLTMYFTDETVLHEKQLKNEIDNCTMLIGIHADSATECIVDVALKHNKPFVVVPCCVFPNLFHQRFIIHHHNSNDVNGNASSSKVPVRSCEQFCEYLLQKDPRFQTSILPFQGRNVAIWWDGTT